LQGDRQEHFARTARRLFSRALSQEPNARSRKSGRPSFNDENCGCERHPAKIKSAGRVSGSPYFAALESSAIRQTLASYRPIRASTNRRLIRWLSVSRAAATRLETSTSCEILHLYRGPDRLVTSSWSLYTEAGARPPLPAASPPKRPIVSSGLGNTSPYPARPPVDVNGGSRIVNSLDHGARAGFASTQNHSRIIGDKPLPGARQQVP